jgi:predicted nuclease of predicted toxin-antitoxin system
VKVIVDAQLPVRAAAWFRAAGCDAVHTLDLPQANRTPDDGVTALADAENRWVVTKDDDFVTSHLLHGRPAKLLLVTTGNIRNRDLETLLTTLMPDILRESATSRFLEVGRSGLIVRG